MLHFLVAHVIRKTNGFLTLHSPEVTFSLNSVQGSIFKAIMPDSKKFACCWRCESDSARLPKRINHLSSLLDAALGTTRACLCMCIFPLSIWTILAQFPRQLFDEERPTPKGGTNLTFPQGRRIPSSYAHFWIWFENFALTFDSHKPFWTQIHLCSRALLKFT